MDFFTSIFSYFEVPLIVMILFGTEFAKMYIDTKISPKWLTLWTGIFFSIIYLIFKVFEQGENINLVGIRSLISFLATTSCYDYVWKPFRDELIKKFSNKEQQ